MKLSKAGVLSGAIIFICLGLATSAYAGGKGAINNKKIVVIIDSQILLAMEGSRVIYEHDVITGRPKKETHPGTYKIGRKFEDYTSKKYDAPMPYSMFFSKDGKAIHGTKFATIRSDLHAYITESVGSHGCVGLTKENAKTLFDWAPIGTRIVVMAEAPDD